MQIKRGYFLPIRKYLTRNGSPDGHITKRLQQMVRNPRRISVPVFLMGNGRSGTSMVVFHLARSYAVDLYNENHPLAFEEFHLKEMPVIEKLIAQSYARVTLFKPILDTYLSRSLLDHFANARILFMFRHYDDVVNSARIRFFDKPVNEGKATYEDLIPPVDRWITEDFAEYAQARPPEALLDHIRALHRFDLTLESKIALHWILHNRLYFDLNLDTDERVFPIQYETLVQQPHEIMVALCAFLGIPFEESLMGGIHAESIRRRAAPVLEPHIRDACEALWQQLIGVPAAQDGQDG